MLKVLPASYIVCITILTLMVVVIIGLTVYLILPRQEMPADAARREANTEADDDHVDATNIIIEEDHINVSLHSMHSLQSDPASNSGYLSEERAIDIGDLEDDFNSNDFKHHPNDNRNGGFGSRVISRISEENESNLSLEEDTAGSQLVNAFETRNGIFYEL